MINFSSLKKSFGFAFEGLRFAWKKDQNLRVHTIVAIVVIVASIILKVSTVEKSILGVMIILVISAEMVNSAIEQMVDLITKEHRMEAKLAKDVASGMVFVTAVGSVIVGMLIFFPYLVKLFK
ncbi:MAG: diacylglycerol kinase family protein [Candidatus Levybacteria bacterium]|nr:diacylglycerol kinase family protein [Candidatus Levybacteria bacterium]